MYFECLIAAQAPIAHPPPAWCADIPIDVRINEHQQLPEGAAFEVDAASIEGKFGDLVVWKQAWQAVGIQTVSKVSSSRLTLRVPMTREIVLAIEKKRGGAGPVRLSIELMIRCREIRATGPEFNAPTWASKSQPVNHRLQDWEIHRDPWRGCLKTLGWNDFQIFELPTGATWEDPMLADALTQLQSAEHLLHFGGDPKAVLSKCYGALESAAKHAVQHDGKKQQGFQALLARAFPGEPDKQSQVNDLIGALNTFAHLGRHEGYPAQHVSWTEARFGLITTLAVFDLLTNNGKRQG
jgi:hypothetical protein